MEGRDERNGVGLLIVRPDMCGLKAVQRRNGELNIGVRQAEGRQTGIDHGRDIGLRFLD